MPTSSTLPFSPASERNKAPILAVLRRLLPPRGTALEIASGTGQHAEHFAAGLPGWTWQPTEADAAMLAPIAARCAGVENVLEPRQLDVRSPAWTGSGDTASSEDGGDTLALPGPFDLIFCANLLHIAPWPVGPALMQGVARRLAPDGRLIVYGPFLVEGEPVAPSNLAFDADLRRRDASWGVRRLGDVADAASAAGLELRERAAMPAHNLTLVFGRR